MVLPGDSSVSEIHRLKGPDVSPAYHFARFSSTSAGQEPVLDLKLC